MEPKKIKAPNRVRKHVNPLADQIVHSFEGFADSKPVIVDIGAYRGEFFYKLLEKYPNTYNAIVSEIRRPIANYLVELFADRPDSVKVFDGDGSKNLKSILHPMIQRGIYVEKVFFNFPDPWLKEKHKKRRVITASFLQDLKTWIEPSTEFIFQTDQKPLFDDTIQLLEEQGISYTEFFDSWEGIKTRWEELKTDQGSPIYRVKFIICK
jgi:tRNA (guanine-N7-)-methyltransferase